MTPDQMVDKQRQESGVCVSRLGGENPQWETVEMMLHPLKSYCANQTLMYEIFCYSNCTKKFYGGQGG